MLAVAITVSVLALIEKHRIYTGINHISMTEEGGKNRENRETCNNKIYEFDQITVKQSFALK